MPIKNHSTEIPSPSNESTLTALKSLFEQFIGLSEKINNRLPLIEWDEEWCSECVLENTSPDEHGNVKWKPVARPYTNLFSSLESALEFKFHPDIVCFYNSFWSDGLIATHPRGDVSLIQIWNQQDEEMLKENLLGHAFAKIKNRLPITIFIGSTSDNQVIAIDNESGKVVLERPGYAAHETLANNVAEFINMLTPTLKQYGE